MSLELVAQPVRLNDKAAHTPKGPNQGSHGGQEQYEYAEIAEQANKQHKHTAPWEADRAAAHSFLVTAAPCSLTHSDMVCQPSGRLTRDAVFRAEVPAN